MQFYAMYFTVSALMRSYGLFGINTFRRPAEQAAKEQVP